MTSRRYLFASLLIAVAAILSAWLHGSNSSSSTFTPTWQDAGPGAGGQVTSMLIYPDGTKIVRTDTNMYYMWNGTIWQPLLNPESLTPTQINTMMTRAGVPSLYPGGGTDIGACAYTTSSTNTLVGSTSIIYALLGYEVFKTVDKGVSWIDTGKTITVPGGGGNDGTIKNGDPYVWCDPASNGQVVYMSQPTGVVQRSMDGGTTWASVSGIAAAVNSYGSLIVGDPNSAVVAGVTQTVYIYVEGTGMYVSTNGGTLFSLTTGGPTTSQKLYMDQFSQVWSPLPSGNTIYKYASGSWSTLAISSGYGWTLAFDPNSTSTATQHIEGTTGSSGVAISNNGGATWSYYSGGITVSLTGDVPWLTTTYQQSAGVTYLNIIWSSFDISGNLFVGAGYGVWYLPSPQTAGTHWTAQSAGIEQLVNNRIISPPGIGPTFVGWDKTNFGDQIPGVYADTSVTYPNTMLNGAWDTAMVPGNNPGGGSWTLVSVINGEPSGGDHSAVSTDGGYSWTPFTAPNGTTQQGGMIAADSATDWIDVPGSNQVPYCTTDGGSTWSPISFPGSPPNSWLGQYYYKHFALAADWVNVGTLYAYDTNGSGTGALFRSTTGCAGTWTNIHSGCISSNCLWDGINSQLEAVPGKASTLLFTSGYQSNSIPGPNPFYRSTNGGATWTALPNIFTAGTFGFGAPKPGGSGDASIIFAGWLSGTYGIYLSADNAATWSFINPWFITTNGISSLRGDPDVYGRVYAGLYGGGYAYYDTADACPWVAMASPNPTANVTGTVTLTARGSGLVPVTSVEFDVDGSAIQTFTGGGVGATYSYSWVSGGVATGSHTLAVKTIGNGCTATKTIPITTH
jgi:hypothetical protein